MTSKIRILLLAGLLTTLAAAGLTGLARPAGAAPGAQQDIPTPTPAPVEDIAYSLEIVGGMDVTLKFNTPNMSSFRLGETLVTSMYPRGMEFTLKPESDQGDIQDVILFIRFVHGTGTRVQAEWDPDRELWVAHPWETGEGQPAWTHFNFYWRVRDTSDNSVDTGEQTVDYWDPNREWFRMESDHVILYWFGFGEDDPDAVARTMAAAMASTEQRRVEGWGRALSYKPIAVVYPDRDSLAEMYGSGIASNRVAGFTSDSLGMSVQVLRGTDIPPGNENCIWATQPEDWTMERRINTIYSTTTHEVTHLYQYDIMGGPRGFLWVSEGQAEWFSLAPGRYDERLRKLATLQDIPSLTTDIGSNLAQADGCYALAYDVGASFFNYLLSNYGGPATHREIVKLMIDNASIYEAVEEVTGKPFMEIENEWRTYLGYPPLSLADVDPVSALEPYEDPVIAEGDVVTLPAMPALSAVYEIPGPKALANGQCFANTPVTILQIGALDGVPYYKVDCMGQIGWMSREQLVGPE